jgi:predicted ATPase/GAF domain-containing protein
MNGNGYLLMLGAYRDNEVSPTHPLMMTVDELQKAKVVVNTITLAPLAFEDTNHLIADTLNCSRQLAQPLTELIVRKTQGNPFFTRQFLKALHEDGLITFNRDCRYWECDIAQVKVRSLTDDVVEFMALQLQKLPDETQQVLKLAACIGNQFDLNTLAIVSEQAPIDAAITLWKALQEGLILPTSQVYKFFQGEQVEVTTVANPTYRFLHDRVQQAAYSLIPDPQKQATHLNIGQLLLRSTAPEQYEEHVFTIVNQLNIGTELIQDANQRQELAQLNLMASRKARTAAAYRSAANYVKTGIELLPETKWQTQYDLTLALYQIAAETAYLNGDFERMERSIEAVLQQAQTPLDQVTVYEIKIEAYIAQNNLLAAIAAGLEILQQLDIGFPSTPNQNDIDTAFQETALAIGNRTPSELLQLATMQEARYLAALQIMMTVVPATFIAQPTLFPLLALKQVYLSVTFGNAAISAFAYSLYALLLCGAGNASTGYEFGQLALNLLEQSSKPHLKPRTFYVSYAFSMHWKEHLHQSLSALKTGYLIGMEVGDLAYTGYCAFEYSAHAYYAGQPLLELAEEVANFNKALGKLKQKTTFVWTAIYHQSILNLIGKAEEPTQLIGETYDERIQIPLHQAASDRVGFVNLLTNKLVLSYLFEDYSLALDCAAQALPYLDAITSKFAIAIFHFYDSLTQLAKYSDTSPEQQTEIVDRVVKNQKKLYQAAQHAPMNHLHKFYLVEAEQACVLGQRMAALEYYDRAIAGAKENGYVQEEALANELAAKFYLDWGKERVAAGYMQEAYYGYARWGARAKVDNLEQRYPELLRPILEKAQKLNPIETLATISAPNLSIHASPQTGRSSSSSSVNATLDFAAILKASQNLSSAIQLAELLHQLSQMILQNSGADLCTLILPNAEGEWEVQAIATPENTQLCCTPLQDNPDLPTKLIYYVKNTREAVIIDDCETDLPVLDEYFSQRRPKSALCLPILNQGNLIGILYLKNRLTSGAFTSDRILILNFLCTQAAISLENARLYQTLQQSETKYRAFVEDVNDVIYSVNPDAVFTYLSPLRSCSIL